MSKHTPGPWRVAGNLSIYAAGQVPIAAPMYAGKDQREIAANARLIAAAPELLDALHDLTALYAASPGANPHFVEKGRAAIAKAKGGV